MPVKPGSLETARRFPRYLRSILSDERGAAAVFLAFGMVVMLGMTGLAIDTGRAYTQRAQLSRAVDAGVLAAARTLRSGMTVAAMEALALAEANGIANGVDGAEVNISFGTNEFGEPTISMTATKPLQTMFMKVFGHDEVNVVSSAMAAVPPVDLVLVLDQSGSLSTENAWDDLQNAAKDFVGHFDDAIDQVALVSFQLRGTLRSPLQGNFTSTLQTQIDNMNSAGDTNAQEGLRLALEQIQGPAVRERSAKVVVFFTDGRPTAFRLLLGGQDRMLAVYTTGSVVRGYFNNPDNLPTDQIAWPNGCNNVSSCGGWNENEVRDEARNLATDLADQIRSQDIFFYSIGLGNPNADHPLKVPDMDWLTLLANEDGATPDQRKGRAYFAPSPAELESVFNQLAQDLLVRLSQ